jgi:hypothetical protein
MLSDTLLRELLLTQLLKPQGSMSQVDDVLKWIEDFKKKEKEKTDKVKASSPDRKILSVKDLAFILFGFAVPGGLLMIQGWAYLWNAAYDSVHMMH